MNPARPSRPPSKRRKRVARQSQLFMLGNPPPLPDIRGCRPNLKSLLSLPKGHSQSAQHLVKKSTHNRGTGGSNEKAISRKRSARRVELGDVGGVRCRQAG